MNLKGLSILIILLLSITIASAEFSFSREIDKGSVCKGASLLFPITVDGTGSFNVNLEGQARGFSLAVPAGFRSTGKQTVYVYVSPNSRVNAGSYDLTLSLSDGASVKKVPFTVEVQDCVNFEVFAESVNKDVCGCQDIVYKYTLRNTGKFKDSYFLNVDGSIKDWLSLSHNSLELNPGEEEEVFVSVKAGCKDFGNQMFTLQVESFGTGKIVNAATNVNVNNCFEFGITADREFLDMCERTVEVIGLEFDNTANQANTYTLSINGPAWANLETSGLNLGPGSKGLVNVLLSPDFGVEGTYDINVKVNSEKGEISKEKNLQVNVRKCHDFSLDIIESESKVCQNSERTFNLNLANTGEIEKTIKLEDNLGWVSLSKGNTELSAEASEIVQVIVNPGNITPGNYELSITASALDESNEARTDKLVIDVLDKSECFAVDLSLNDLEIVREGTGTLPVTIRNNGVETGTYEIGLSGSSSGFVQVNPGVITIEPGTSEIVYVLVNPSRSVSYGDYNLQVSVNNDESGLIVSKNANVKVIEPGVEERVTGSVSVVVEESLWSKIKGWFRKSFNIDNEVSGETTTTLVIPITVVDETSTTLTEETTTTIVEETTTPLEETTTTLSSLPEVDLGSQPVISEDSKFTYKDEEHTIRIDDVDENKVTIIIQSDPQVIDLNVNESREVDLDGDGKEDVNVRLESVNNGVPNIIMTELNDTAGGGSYRNFIIIGVIILVVIILISIFVFKEDDNLLEDEVKPVEDKKEIKKEIQEAEEVLDEDSEKIPVGRWILSILLIGVVLWLGFRYDIFDNLGLYKYYIVLGIVLLIILILLIKYWKSIVDFFEEEIDEESEKEEVEEVNKEEKPKKEIKKEEKKEKPKAKKKSKGPRAVAG